MLPHPHRYAVYAADRSAQFIAEATRRRDLERLPPAEQHDLMPAPARGLWRSLRERLDEIAHRPIRRPAEGGFGR